MRKCEVYRFKRQALGISQEKVAEYAGVSAATVGNFENGKEVSIPAYRAIIATVDSFYSKLPKQQYLEANLIYQTLKLPNETPEEKKKTLGYITINLGKLMLELNDNSETQRDEA